MRRKHGRTAEEEGRRGEKQRTEKEREGTKTMARLRERCRQNPWRTPRTVDTNAVRKGEAEDAVECLSWRDGSAGRGTGQRRSTRRVPRTPHLFLPAFRHATDIYPPRVHSTWFDRSGFSVLVATLRFQYHHRLRPASSLRIFTCVSPKLTSNLVCRHISNILLQYILEPSHFDRHLVLIFRVIAAHKMSERAAAECNSLSKLIMCQLPLASQRDVPYRGDIRGESVASGARQHLVGTHNAAQQLDPTRGGDSNLSKITRGERWSKCQYMKSTSKNFHQSLSCLHLCQSNTDLMQRARKNTTLHDPRVHIDPQVTLLAD